MIIELFSDRDVQILEKLEYNPSAQPSYDEMHGCITWEDEYDADLSSKGHELLYELWIARAQIHKGESFDKMALSGDYYEALWNSAIDSELSWNGFQRLELSDEDKKFLFNSLKEV